MKLNQELINLLANGKIQLHHNGTVEQLNEILKAAFPGDKVKVEMSPYDLTKGRISFRYK